MNTYQQTVLNARKQFLKLNKSQEKELLNLYTELAKQLEVDISKCRTTSSELYLKKLHNIVVANIRDMHGDLKKIISENITTSSEIASSVDYAYYEAITNNTGLLATFNSMVMTTREHTVNKLIQGNFYKDKTSLSERLWSNSNKNIKSIDIAIKTNVLRGANARELAKNIEKYVNPQKRIDIKTDEVGFNKNVSYNSIRLARTSITHSFSESMINNAMNNPFNRGLKWNLSTSHSIRMHGKTDMCDDNAGKVFKPEEIPLQHPCCLCYFTEENVSISEASKRLKEWSDGAEDKELDEWYNLNKNNFNTDATIEVGPKKKNDDIEKIKEYKSPLPKRHVLESLGKKSTAKDKNTIILPEVDYHKDIEDIKNGLYNKVEDTFIVNNRTYGAHDGRFYPIEGEGFITLDRNEYKLLIKLKTEYNNPKIKEILKNMEATEEIINRLLNILQKEDRND